MDAQEQPIPGGLGCSIQAAHGLFHWRTNLLDIDRLPTILKIV